MFRLAALLGLLGLAAATGIIVWSGWAQVSVALQQAGWLSVFVLAVFHVFQITISAAGWQVLVPGRNRPSFGLFAYFMWLRAAINNLMPVARIGGEIAVVRVMVAHGMRQSVAIAATIVELTLSIAAIFVFVSVGALLFALRVSDKTIAIQLLWGVALSAPLIAAFAAVQRIGFFGLLSRLFRALFRDKWASMAGSAARLDKAVSAIYRRHGRVILCGLLQFASWSLGSVDVWLALNFLGHPLPLIESAMIEALIQGSASAAFAIPGALGIQEAGFLLVGGLLGLPPGTSAALAVLRRCRDLLCYAPGLVVWQAHEGKRLLKR